MLPLRGRLIHDMEKDRWVLMILPRAPRLYVNCGAQVQNWLTHCGMLVLILMARLFVESMNGLSRVGRVYDEKDSTMSKDLRYWKKAEDVPTDVVFHTTEDWEYVWVENDDGTRTLCFAELVPVKWERKVAPIEDAEDADWVFSCGPYFEGPVDE